MRRTRDRGESRGESRFRNDHLGRLERYAVQGDGEVNLVVADDKYEGSAAMVVLLDSGGAILSQKATSVGEKS